MSTGGGVFPYVFRQFLVKFFIYCCFSATDRPFFTSDLRNKCFMTGGQNMVYQIHPDSCTEHPKQSLKCAGHNTGSATSGALLCCFHTKALSFRADPAFKQRPQPHMALIPVLTLRPHQNRAHRASGGYDLGRQRQPRHIKKAGGKVHTGFRCHHHRVCFGHHRNHRERLIGFGNQSVLSFFSENLTVKGGGFRVRAHFEADTAIRQKLNQCRRLSTRGCNKRMVL